MKTKFLEPRVIVDRSGVAQDSAVSISTVRNWDEIGVIKPVITVGKIRRYDLVEVRKQLANISK